MENPEVPQANAYMLEAATNAVKEVASLGVDAQAANGQVAFDTVNQLNMRADLETYVFQDIQTVCLLVAVTSWRSGTVGITSTERNLAITKYYTDGSEEAGKLNQPISGDGIKPISLPQAQSIIDKANEGSKKAAGFALRLKDSMDSMNQLSKSIDPKRVALINRSLGDGTIANLSLSPAEQQYMVNARDALYAILRPETGAAITLPEMQEYSKMYLPQPGDSRAATETKMRKMQGQYNSLRGQSGRVYDALVVSSAANSQQQSNSQQPTNTQQQQSQSGSYTSKSGIQFTVE